MAGRALSAVVVVAGVDWPLAAAMAATGTLRPVSVPLAAVAAGTVLTVQAPAVAEVRAAVRDAPVRGRSRWSAAEAALARRWSPRAARCMLREPRLLLSVVLLLRGRRDGHPPPTFAAHRDALPVWTVLGAVAAVEVAVTAALPLPRPVGAVLLVLGVWGLAVVAGFSAALVVHPHVVDRGTVRVRFGFWDEVTLPRTAITAARVTPHTPAAGGLHVTGHRATLSPAGTTNVQLRLSRPVHLDGHPVTELRLWADQPADFTRACTGDP